MDTSGSVGPGVNSIATGEIGSARNLQRVSDLQWDTSHLYNKVGVTVFVQTILNCLLVAVGYYQVGQHDDRLETITWVLGSISAFLGLLGTLTMASRNSMVMSAFVVCSVMLGATLCGAGLVLLFNLKASCYRVQRSFKGCGGCGCAHLNSCSVDDLQDDPDCHHCQAWPSEVCSEFESGKNVVSLLLCFTAVFINAYPAIVGLLVLVRKEHLEGGWRARAHWARVQLRDQMMMMESGYPPTLEGATYMSLVEVCSAYDPELAQQASLLFNVKEARPQTTGWSKSPKARKASKESFAPDPSEKEEGHSTKPPNIITADREGSADAKKSGTPRPKSVLKADPESRLKTADLKQSFGNEMDPNSMHGSFDHQTNFANNPHLANQMMANQMMVNPNFGFAQPNFQHSNFHPNQLHHPGMLNPSAQFTPTQFSANFQNINNPFAQFPPSQYHPNLGQFQYPNQYFPNHLNPAQMYTNQGVPLNQAMPNQSYSSNTQQIEVAAVPPALLQGYADPTLVQSSNQAMDQHSVVDLSGGAARPVLPTQQDPQIQDPHNDAAAPMSAAGDGSKQPRVTMTPVEKFEPLSQTGTDGDPKETHAATSRRNGKEPLIEETAETVGSEASGSNLVSNDILVEVLENEYDASHEDEKKEKRESKTEKKKKDKKASDDDGKAKKKESKEKVVIKEEEEAESKDKKKDKKDKKEKKEKVKVDAPKEEEAPEEKGEKKKDKKEKKEKKDKDSSEKKKSSKESKSKK